MRRLFAWLPLVLLSACMGDAAGPATTATTSTTAPVSTTTTVPSPSTTDGTTTTSAVDPATVVAELFGDRLPSRVVVALADSLEVWEGGQHASVSHPMSHRLLQVEGGMAVLAVDDTTAPAVVDLFEPEEIYPIECPRLMSRGEEILALDQCSTDRWSLVEVASGEEREAPIPFQQRSDGEYVWFAERGGTVVTGVGDAEGNLTRLSKLDGTDLLGDGYAGLATLSTDGRFLAYSDHADPAALSHFWSPVVVVVETETGEETGRWILEHPISCIEFAETWVVVCEVEDPLTPQQRALVAIDVATGDLNRIETKIRVFLPSG